MSTPGIADPYWYEWYVGLDNIIKMLNPDNGIDYVIFQSEDYDTIDDVVVGYKNGTQEVCYQVKHEILSSTKHNLTFGTLIKQSPNKKVSLFCALIQSFCNQLVQDLKATDKKVVFISGEPGCGKTSIISYLQSKYNLFSLRFHTFKPISPNQHFYSLDEGMCSPENLWGTMLIQLRTDFKGRLAEYRVPLNNKFCSTAELRQHVCRLLGILGSEALEKSEKVLVCIDGIDHAARAKGHVTFLDSLFIPEEIPAGVCIVIVGQPADLYQAQYPSWLYTSDSVMRISVPPLCLVDIQQLIEERTPQFSDEKIGLSKLIYHYTLGNNLSTVFAVEELVSTTSYEDAVTHIQESGISHDIQQYYQHIWNYVRQELSEIGLGIPFPESIVACPLLLMNGRVKTSILENALSYRLTNSDWCQIFNRLYPLVYRCENDGEYAIFHNDFRVFLMGIINNYLPKYREIALQLAQYFIENNVLQKQYC